MGTRTVHSTNSFSEPRFIALLLTARYTQDSRSSGLFHYLLSGDDSLMRQALVGFAASLTPEGVIESRYPSHFHQVIAGFCLFWILELRDHHLYFNDVGFSRSLLPVADSIFAFFDRHVDERGLVSELPSKYWSYVDWAKEWVTAPDHPDGGVPFAGRKTSTHTYFSLLYSYVLQQAAELMEWHDRHGMAKEYRCRAKKLNEAVKTHCYDGQYTPEPPQETSVYASSATRLTQLANPNSFKCHTL